MSSTSKTDKTPGRQKYHPGPTARIPETAINNHSTDKTDKPTEVEPG